MSENNGGGGQLAGKVVAVTGATSGSGLAIARRFAAEGADVVLMARGVDRLKALEEELGPRAVGLTTDVGDAESVRAAFDAVGGRFGKLDALINNAGLHRPCPFERLTDDEILTQVRCNLLGPIYTCRAAIPLLRAAGGGDIINTSSEVTLEVFPYEAVYKSTKAGLEALGQALSLEFEKEEIRVTTLIQGVALGEGGGSTDWQDSGEHTQLVWPRLQAEGTINRVIGKHGGMTVESVADVHVFIVTRPRGQKLDVIRVRSY
ncbi:SDR family oxidoreductase [Frankia sp. CNm7]|uniref:SDR family oxidoreductase n=1 Tax=Frankia nepalensis TaxID=1836974 RepID=A0A937UMK6_9ACTN|nr:SDR family oxidoreductase [Frankia nepalensis]MBL7502263.1 SDR family oxidoreductase [Frankia nepalensis]MBL7515955.1 SDR family oxidoreductase [Frankia nepalensis]MBL7522550.1 SDR family oxidoreductase [Frankia nepalensis]MBL7627163.1 SDR family oxidoreductase [Frankia nepalensis]